jgi:hypothetical protein
MATVSQTGFPPSYIGKYIQAQLQEFGVLTGQEQFDLVVPATSPTNIEELYGNYLGAPGNESPVLIMYDRMARYRPSPFYRHKREQLIYTVYSNSLDNVYNVMRIIFEALDRQDASAEDVNKWIKDNIPSTDPKNVFFHRFKAFQIDETRDLLELASVRLSFVNKIIIEYDYHTTDSYYA